MPMQGKSPSWDQVEHVLARVLSNAAHAALVESPADEIAALRSSLRLLDETMAEQFGHELKLGPNPVAMGEILDHASPLRVTIEPAPEPARHAGELSDSQLVSEIANRLVSESIAAKAHRDELAELERLVRFQREQLGEARFELERMGRTESLASLLAIYDRNMGAVRGMQHPTATEAREEAVSALVRGIRALSAPDAIRTAPSARDPWRTPRSQGGKLIASAADLPKPGERLPSDVIVRPPYPSEPGDESGVIA